jgi:hypothetical protein
MPHRTYHSGLPRAIRADSSVITASGNRRVDDPSLLSGGEPTYADFFPGDHAGAALA